jgi:hypothetical protein
MKGRVVGSLTVVGAAPALAAPAVAGAGSQVVPSPDPSGHNDGQLNAAVVTGAADAWAAGDGRMSGGTFGTLMAHWAGQSWQLVPSASVLANDMVILSGLAAAGRAAARVVGSDWSTHVTHSIIEHWNGHG